MDGAPVFEEFEPESDCDCPGCIHRRRDLARGLPVRLGGHPAAHGARRALVLATAAGTVLGGGQALPAVAAPGVPGTPAGPVVPGDDGPGPQGGTSALHGAPGALGAPGPAVGSAVRATTRAEILQRARQWVAAKVPYSMDAFWSDGYRQDCSGFVSMAWDLGGNEWTGSLAAYAVRITKAQLKPGDILLFHNPANPEKGSHVTIFGGWTDASHTRYTAYEQARPYARKQTTPYAYWSNAGRYLAYRYKGVTDGTPGGSGPSTGMRYPGAGSFGPGADNKYVTRLGKALVGRGGGRFYRTGPGPRWGDADRRATQAFQRAQGWSGADADGLPGPTTWSYLMKGKGRDIPAAGAGAGAGGAHGKVPAYPGRGVFRPGQSSPSIEKLGRQLVKKGFGKHYAKGPSPRWSESDRRNVEAFQRAQGWRGVAADGYPGPETWRRLFS
ncbi:peptidoglycan-binding protein [Streptomyces sp. NBC_01381]|uniref:peptidoglycan-binding protein n=1 Tax=Streptomyces sp. NBC_01381 TaxID=2903845 RepID=UPI00224FFB27|nr:peptidoglycan-binding protein [Streptomyces sp. NBC_01381]MCX4667019.1 peptidoglycan-binding protein [Streptomyces sp. NBC_01381]